MNDSHNPERSGSLPEDWESASADEHEAAARLREALERTPDRPDSDLEFIEALRSAVRPAAIEPKRHDALLSTALGRRPGKVVYPLFAAGTAVALAAAAALVLVFGWQNEGAPPPSAAHTIPCRSAADLFDRGFPVTGGTSSRVDRIATVRERDLRDNMFAQWQVP